MTRKERIRRAALVCFHYTRNLAYYRAGWDGLLFKKDSEFWKTTNSNFLDLATLEWCKLFGDYDKEKHHWKNIVKNKTKYKQRMLEHSDIDEAEFKKLWNKVRRYRDKFIAHLDSDTEMNTPLMDKTYSTIVFYYNELRKYAEDGFYLDDLPLDLEAYYDKCFKEALAYYGQKR